jgi:hypothetical protein
MTRHDRSRKAEKALRRQVRLGFEVDACLASAAERIAEAEEAFRKLAEPRRRD